MCSFSNSKNCKRYFSVAICLAVIASSLIFFVPPAFAQNPTYGCFYLMHHKNRFQSYLVNYYGQGSSPVASDLPTFREACRDGGITPQILVADSPVVATRVISVSSASSLSLNNQVWKLSDIASQLGCTSDVTFPGMGQLIALLPSSPENAKIPTILSNMLGSGTLAGNLAVELFSGIWQYLALFTSFKMFKLLRG